MEQSEAKTRSARRTLLNLLRVIVVRGLGIVVSLAASILIANRFGATPATDAFFLARNVVMELTEALRRVVLIQLVPSFANAARDGSTRRVLRRALLGLGALGCVMAIALAFFGDAIAGYLATGFNEDHQKMAGHLFAILGFLIPAGLIIAVLGSVLNAGRKFGYAELAAILPRIGLVVVLLFLVPPASISALAWAMAVCSGIGIVLLAVVSIRARARDRATAEPKDTASAPEVGGNRFLSILLIQVYNQLTLWMNYWFISGLAEGSISKIEYSQKLMQLLPGVLSMSIVTVIYTEMAAGSGRPGVLPGLVRRTVLSGLFVLIPVIVTLAAFASYIVDILLGHGAFSDEAIQETAHLMQVYAIGVPLGLVTNIFVIALLSDTSARQLLVLGATYAAGLLLQFLSLSLLTRTIGLDGVPATAAIVALANLILLLAYLKDYRAALVTGEFFGPVLKQVSAGAATLIFLLLVPDLIGLRADSIPVVGLLASLAAFSVAGIAIYLGLCRLLGVADIETAKRILRR